MYNWIIDILSIFMLQLRDACNMSEDSIANIYANSNFYKFTEMKLKQSFVALTIIFNRIFYMFLYII